MHCTDGSYSLQILIPDFIGEEPGDLHNDI